MPSMTMQSSYIIILVIVIVIVIIVIVITVQRGSTNLILTSCAKNKL